MKDKFIEQVFEIAFGDGAINKNYSYDDVIDRLHLRSESEYNAVHILLTNYSSIDDFIKDRNIYLDTYIK